MVDAVYALLKAVCIELPPGSTCRTVARGMRDGAYGRRHMSELTVSEFCGTHVGAAASGSCERCGRAFCDECRVEDLGAERVFCSEACRDAERAVSSTPDRDDHDLIAGYLEPVSTGWRSWTASLALLSRTIAPLALLAALGAGIAELYSSTTAYLLYTAIGIFGVALVGVTSSRAHTGHGGDDSPWILTIKRIVPWTVTWFLVIGLLLLGYAALIVPGIILNLRILWADEFVLVHRASPFKAMNESWQISRGQMGRTFPFELGLGFLSIPIFGLAFAIPAGVSYFLTNDTAPGIWVSSAVAGITAFMLLQAYALVHMMQIALFYGLRANLAAEGPRDLPRPIPRVLQWASVPAAALVVALVVLDAAKFSGYAPSYRVLVGEELSDSQREVLLTEGIVTPDERIEYFYSFGITSVKTGGSVLTDLRVLSYIQLPDNSIEVYYVTTDDIGSVRLLQQGNADRLSVYQVNSASIDDAWIQLFLPHDFGDDRRFVEAVQKHIR